MGYVLHFHLAELKALVDEFVLGEGRVEERGEDIREILSEDERGIAVAVISSWSGDGGPAIVAERTNENPRKGRANWTDGANVSLEE